jgi:hypothetical protein
MCGALFKTPKVKEVAMPTKEEAVSKEDSTVTEQQKKRKGFTSTIATSGMGVTDAAPTKKTQLGT